MPPYHAQWLVSGTESPENETLSCQCSRNAKARNDEMQPYLEVRGQAVGRRILDARDLLRCHGEGPVAGRSESGGGARAGVTSEL
jgi:hypothetical protein